MNLTLGKVFIFWRCTFWWWSFWDRSVYIFFAVLFCWYYDSYIFFETYWYYDSYIFFEIYIKIESEVWL